MESASLINRFHKRLLSDGDDGIEIAKAMKSKLDTSNRLQSIIENYGLDRKRAQFKKIDANSITDFPKTDQGTIRKKITFGSYQLQQSLSYLAEHLNESGNFETEAFADKNGIFDSNQRLLRTHTQSRHSSSTKYNSYILYCTKDEPNREYVNRIEGWFCTCKNGARTAGCCSHLASVIYHMSYGRYHHLSKPAASLPLIFSSSVVLEASDEDEDETSNITTSATVTSDTTEILSDTTEILDEATEEHGPEQYITIYPDLSHLMELESHTTQSEETTPTTSHMWSQGSPMG